jgi:glutamate-1-semialdehyde 2,1-aminomutase
MAGDPAARQRLQERETKRFAQRHPASLAWLRDSAGVLPDGVPMSWMRELYLHPPPVVAHAEGVTFTDLDGNRFRDFNLCDMSVLAGWAHPVVMRAAAERLAAGGQFLLPTDDGRALATELAARLGGPKWRFTLSATQANVEVLRICRASTWPTVASGTRSTQPARPCRWRPTTRTSTRTWRPSTASWPR